MAVKGKFTKADPVKIVELTEKGCSVRQIAIRLGTSRTMVTKRLREAGYVRGAGQDMPWRRADAVAA